MTNEYALHLLSQLQIGASVDAKPIIPQYEFAQALGVAIKALEQQQDVHDTCKECIEFSEFEKQLSLRDKLEKEYLVESLTEDLQKLYAENEELHKKLEQQPSEDCISREDTLKEFKRVYFDNATIIRCAELILGGMPSVTPERPKGKWLHIYKSDIACECSVCHIQMPITEYFHYCPNCGAEMEGGEDGDSN